MDRNSKKAYFRFTFSHLWRLILFAALIYLGINYFSQRSPKTNPNILGQATQDWTVTLNDLSIYLTPQQKSQLDSISQNPLVKSLLLTAGEASGNLPAFIDKQIILIKKSFVTSIYLDIIKSIEN